MPVIEFQTKHKSKGLFDYIVEDDDGMVSDTVRVETTKLLVEGDLCSVHLCDYNGVPAVFKIARSATDNDLLEKEARILDLLHKDSEGKFPAYLPEVKHSAQCDGKAVNIFPYYDDEWYTLEEVIRAFPEGIDFRDAVWMYKRALIGVGYAHGRGVIHGAMLPPHILVHMGHHGAKVLDWCHAVQAPDRSSATEHLKVISNAHQKYYPPEVFDKKPAHPSMDIYMATMTMVALLGGDVESKTMPLTVPEELRSMLRTCLNSDLRRRPQDAWVFHNRLDELLKEIVGDRKYRYLKMPTSARSEP